MKFTWIVLILLAGHNCAFARLVMTPWLQGVTGHSVWVLAECTSTKPVRVMYGADKKDPLTTLVTEKIKTSARPATWVHHTFIEGLTPGTRYFYRVIHESDTSTWSSFYTAVEPGTPFRLAWLADCRTGTDTFRLITRHVMHADPMVSLFGGDLCSDGSYSAWKNEFFTPEIQSLGRSIPYVNSPGNQEGWSRNSRAFTRQPGNSPESKGYFSFDYGDVHLLCINQEVPLTPGTEQYSFILEDLMQTKQRWKIVMTHRPVYGGGDHGNDRDIMRLTSEIFEPSEVDIVLADHYKKYTYVILDAAKAKLKMYVYDIRGDIIDTIILEKPVP